jgi:hypothetical protein
MKSIDFNAKNAIKELKVMNRGDIPDFIMEETRKSVLDVVAKLTISEEKVKTEETNDSPSRERRVYGYNQ